MLYCVQSLGKQNSWHLVKFSKLVVKAGALVNTLSQAKIKLLAIKCNSHSGENCQDESEGKMKNCSVSTRRLAEVSISMGGKIQQLCHALHPLQSSSVPSSSMVPFCPYRRQSCYSYKVFQVMHTVLVQVSAALYLCCAGERTYRPGGGPGRKDSGSGVLSRGAQGEAECHRGDAAAGISQTHVCCS